MAVRELLMRAGAFEVKLAGKPATTTTPASGAPASILSAVNLADQIVITPTRLMPIGSFSDANILSVAIYSGVCTNKPDRYTIAGQGLAWYMGSDDGLGDQIQVAVATGGLGPATLTTWVGSLKPASISAGTVTDTGTSYAGSYQYMTPREALTHATRQMGAEWRINPNCTLDAAAPATLFGATAKGLITRKPEGSEGTLRGFEATDIVAGSNLDGYTTTTIVVGSTGVLGSAAGANVYKDFLNANLVMERLVDAPQEAAATVATTATKVQAMYGSVRRTITVDTRTFAVPLDVRPGNYVYVYDPDTNTVDTANQQQWRGETISPVLLRCRGYTWGLKKGMGVYARTSAGVYTDLSDWVAWENDLDTSWEIGSSPTDLDQNPDQLAGAFLGTNPNLVTRVAGGLGVLGVHSLNTAFTTVAAHNVSQNEGLTLTIDDVIGRRYRFSFVLRIFASGGIQAVRLTLQRDGVDIHSWDASPEQVGLAFSSCLTPWHTEVIAATHAASVYRLQIKGVTANTAVDSGGAAGFARQFIIEDLGMI